MSYRILTALAIAAAALCTGCTNHADDMAAIQVGMSTKQTIAILGAPKAVIATLTNKHGQQIQVYEYFMEFNNGMGSSSGGGAHYWYVFADGKFAYSRPASSNWETAEAKIYETKI